MDLRHQRLAAWWLLVCVWVAIGLASVVETRTTQAYLNLLDASSMLPSDVLPMRRSVPADYLDTQTWLQLAVSAEYDGGWRSHHTNIDNSPYGRDVYWNAELIRLLDIAGDLTRRATDESFATALERATSWINLPIFMLVVVVFTVWIAARTGVAGAVLVSAGMLGHPSFYAGFAPNYFDHHGLLTASAFGTIVGVMFMGAGWVANQAGYDSWPSIALPLTHRNARNAALVSAVCGGLGMWISAPSIIPTIAIVGVAGVTTTFWWPRRFEKTSAKFHADLWRLWGRAGAVISIAAYVVEYAPRHFKMRLEVNHPLYSIAWLAGAELIAAIGDCRANGAKPRTARTVLAAAGLAAAPLFVAFGGTKFFGLRDAGLLRLHGHIAEFQPIGSAIRLLGDQVGARLGLDLIVLGLAAVLLLVGRKQHPLIAFTALVVVGSGMMATLQFRWWLSAGAAELVFLLALSTTLGRTSSRRVSIGVVAAVCLLLALEAVVRIHSVERSVADRAVTSADAMQPIYRDAAVAIRKSHPDGDVVLLASPNASTSISYFGRFKSIGTLYWENVQGLRASAEMLTPATDEQARALLLTRGVTHIAVFSRDDFLKEYLELLGKPSRPDDVAHTFGYRLLRGEVPPRWLRPLGLRLPTAAEPGLTVRLFEVVPEQDEFDATWNIAVARLVEGNRLSAESKFREAVDGVPPERRPLLYATAGRMAYQENAQALAVQLLYRGLSKADNPQIRTNLAWILATSVDDSVRNGMSALGLIEPMVRSFSNDPTVLDVYAAALAETGRFEQAVMVTTRILALAEHDTTGVAARASERLKAYNSRRPWRQ